ncbi:MAG: hypothetical protein LRZ92_06440 [Methanosarcinaceae archaeon]|jgi:hypothetical protein|nr:hypothetical protein [Methanosarcinaceae archaeon]
MSKIEELEEQKCLEGLYDLIVPPGLSSKIIYETVEKFELEALNRDIKVGIIENDSRDVMVLRGNLETVQAAEKFMYDKLQEWVNSDD